MNEFLTRISYFFSALLSGLSLVSLNQLTLVVGLFLSIMMFIITWVYKHKTYKLHVKYAEMQSDLDLERTSHSP